MLVGLGGLVACSDDGAGRHAYHVARSRGIFGASQRLTITAAPGVIRECENSGTLLEVCARAGSPFPALRVSNGNLDSTEALLRIANLSADPLWDVYLEPLLPEEPQDQRCAREALGPPAGSSTRLADAAGAQLLVAVQGCASLVLVGKANDAQAQRPYRVALLGGASLRDGELRAFLQSVLQRDTTLDFVYFLDDVNLRNSPTSLEELDDIMQEFDVPWSMVMSPRSLARGYVSFVDRLGSLDYLIRVHGMPLLVLDTANARVNHAQQASLKAVRSCKVGTCPPAVALMSIPPVGTHNVDVGIFRSQVLAQDIFNLLAGLGARAIVSSAEEASDSKRFSNLTLFDVGSFQDREDFLELSFFPAAQSAVLCDAPLTLAKPTRWTVGAPHSVCTETQVCQRGVCLMPCTSTSDCEEAHHECAPDGICREPCVENVCLEGRCASDGYCDTSPTLRLQRLSL